MWLERFLKRVTKRRSPAKPSRQERRVAEVLYRESAYDSPREFLEALLERVPAEEPLEESTLARLVSHLRGHYDETAYQVGEALPDLLWFWHALAERSGSPFAQACYADTMRHLDRKRAAEALDVFLAACGREPALFCEFAGEFLDLSEDLGGELRFRFQLAGLRAALQEEDDEVRELYSELLEDYTGDPHATARLREVGFEIDAAVAAGRLPRALVRRGSWRVR